MYAPAHVKHKQQQVLNCIKRSALVMWIDGYGLHAVQNKTNGRSSTFLLPLYTMGLLAMAPPMAPLAATALQLTQGTMGSFQCCHCARRWRQREQ
jgi:hypothetical protein